MRTLLLPITGMRTAPSGSMISARARVTSNRRGVARGWQREGIAAASLGVTRLADQAVACRQTAIGSLLTAGRESDIIGAASEKGSAGAETALDPARARLVENQGFPSQNSPHPQASGRDETVAGAIAKAQGLGRSDHDDVAGSCH